MGTNSLFPFQMYPKSGRSNLMDAARLKDIRGIVFNNIRQVPSMRHIPPIGHINQGDASGCNSLFLESYPASTNIILNKMIK